MSQEPDLSQIWDFCRNRANNKTFHYINQIQKKSVTKFSNKFKKPYYGHFSHFWGKKNFLQNIWLCHANLHIGP